MRHMRGAGEAGGVRFVGHAVDMMIIYLYAPHRAAARLRWGRYMPSVFLFVFTAMLPGVQTAFLLCVVGSHD